MTIITKKILLLTIIKIVKRDNNSNVDNRNSKQLKLK